MGNWGSWGSWGSWAFIGVGWEDWGSRACSRRWEGWKSWAVGGDYGEWRRKAADGRQETTRPRLLVGKTRSRSAAVESALSRETADC
ncbi:MAG: hypothetical protein IJO06_11955 [Thermoguttaceae bacterium]|nr:hypothetical protein [Thermoguttaceae bacterium]MBQ7111914.1 hypothetical protein [Thermoguttaceae bacterium]